MNAKGTIDLTYARLCVQEAAHAYAEATFESQLAHVLVIPATAACPKIIAFRGSADVRAWLTDFEIGFRSTVYGRVHAGFWNSVQSVILDLLSADGCGKGPAIITGHSKGAAEALICARLLAAAGRPVLRVVTFGGPRVGNSMWRDGYNLCQMSNGQRLGDVTERWVHEEDIVARVPVWLAKYRHTWHEYFMSSFGGVQVDPPLLTLAASDLWGTFWGYRAGRIEQAMDHPIARYQEHLASL